MCPEISNIYVPRKDGQKGCYVSGEDNKAKLVKQTLFDSNNIKEIRQIKDANGSIFHAISLDSKSDQDDNVDQVILFNKGGVQLDPNGNPAIIDASKVVGSVFNVEESRSDISQTVPQPDGTRRQALINAESTVVNTSPLVRPNTNELTNVGTNATFKYRDDYQEAKLNEAPDKITDQAIEKNIAQKDGGVSNQADVPNLGDQLIEMFPKLKKDGGNTEQVKDQYGNYTTQTTYANGTIRNPWGDIVKKADKKPEDQITPTTGF